MSEGSTVSLRDSIAVIGGGIVGLSLAWRLAQSGWQVTVFEKGDPGREASWAGAGMLVPGGEAERASPLAEMFVESRQLYSAFVRELERDSGLAIDYQECGALDLAYSQQELEILESRAREQAVAGIDSKPLESGQIKTFWPRVRTEGLAGARFYPNDALVDPRAVLAALEKACRQSGVAIQSHCSVSRIDVSNGAAKVGTPQTGQSFAAAVVAAGAWSSGIHVTGAPALPFAEPVKGHLIGYQQPEQTCNTILRHGHTYLLQRANGLLICGASTEHAGFDRTIQPAIAAELARQAAFILPHLEETTPSEVWIGFRPGSEALHIGPWHSSHLYLAYGHYRNGILLAPLTARQLAATINANWQTR